MKRNLEIEDFEDKKTQGGKRYTRFKTDDGWMSCFDKEIAEYCLEQLNRREQLNKITTRINKLEADTNEMQTDDVPGIIATLTSAIDGYFDSGGSIELLIDAILADTAEIENIPTKPGRPGGN